MRISTVLAAICALLPLTNAKWKGFNIKSNLADGVTCKTEADYFEDFHTLTTFPNKINSVRLYQSWYCDTLANAIPAATRAGLFIVAGVNTTNNFDNEKGALLSAVKKYGFDNILAIGVGNEDLYRGFDPATLAQQIYDVRGMLSEVAGYNKSIKIGHVDTNNGWTNASNEAVIRACDFVGTDVYPYFQNKQNNSIENSDTLFEQGVASVKKAVAKAGSTASVWVSETGWPVNGTTKGLAVAGTGNARTYWEKVACSSFEEYNTFWFTLQDFYALPSFAVVDPDFNLLYDLSCP